MIHHNHHRPNQHNQEHKEYLVMLQPPLLIAMKAPQLWTNVKNGHTGQVWGRVSRCIVY